MIDELAHAGSEHLDPAFAAGYDRTQPDFWKAIALTRIARQLRPGGIRRLHGAAGGGRSGTGPAPLPDRPGT